MNLTKMVFYTNRENMSLIPSQGIDSEEVVSRKFFCNEL